MQYRALGKSGIKVSAISMGGWLTFGGSISDTESHRILGEALDGGINYLDLADVYARGEAERVVGQFVKTRKRSQLVLASKCFWPMGPGPNDRGLSRKHIFESIESSLRRLQTDYLDIFYCHREDPQTPLEETARAMEDLLRQGKILYWGTSCWKASTLVKAHGLARLRGWAAPTVEQPRYNLLDREIEGRVLPVARKVGMGVVVWSPLAGGALTGKYDEGVPEGSRAAGSSWLNEVLTPENKRRLRTFSGIARDAGLAPSQLALAWVLAQPGISSVITGATKAEQVRENLQGADLRLHADVLSALEKLFPRK